MVDPNKNGENYDKNNDNPHPSVVVIVVFAIFIRIDHNI